MLAIAALVLAAPSHTLTTSPAATIVVVGDISVIDLPEGGSVPSGVIVEAVRTNANNAIDTSRVSRQRFVIIIPSNDAYKLKLKDGSGALLNINVPYTPVVASGQKWIEAPTLATRYLGGNNANALTPDEQVTLRIENLSNLAEGMEGDGQEATVLEIGELMEATANNPALRDKLNQKIAGLKTSNPKFGEYYDSSVGKETLDKMRLAAGVAPLTPEQTTRLEAIIMNPNEAYQLRNAAIKRKGPGLTDDSPLVAFMKDQLATGGDFAFSSAEAMARSSSPSLHDFVVLQIKASDAEKAIPAIYAATKANLPGATQAFFNRLDSPLEAQKTRLIGVLSDLPGPQFKLKLTGYATSNDSTVSKAAKNGLIGRKDLTDQEKRPYRFDIVKDFTTIDFTQPFGPNLGNDRLKDIIDRMNKEKFKGLKLNDLPPR